MKSMAGLHKAYFIGGEWDGVQKRVAPNDIVPVVKSKHIKTKVRLFHADEVDIEVEVEEYMLVNHFPDGVLVYRLTKDIDECRRQERL